MKDSPPPSHAASGSISGGNSSNNSGTSSGVTTSNIALIMEAEQQAAKIVGEARQYRVDRVKQARETAVKDMHDLRVRLNDEFEQFAREQDAVLQSDLAAIAAESEVRKRVLTESAERGRPQVVQVLLQAVTGLPAERIEPFLKQPSAAL